MVKRLIFAILLSGTCRATDNCSNLPAQTNLPWNALAATPVMGWSSWYPIGLSVSDAYVRTQADAMVSRGLAAVGYNYVLIDDGWPAATRDGSGNIQPDATKFPSGMAALFSYIHGAGLRTGIYTSPNTTTCGGYMGSGLHESADAVTFASWGSDFLKYDGCNIQNLYASCYLTKAPQIWQLMAQSITTAARPMVLLTGVVPTDPWLWAANAGYNQWRSAYTYDLNNTWSNFAGPGKEIDLWAELSSFQHIGGWNDPDLLIGGTATWINSNFFTAPQRRTQISMYALWSSPLIIGFDVVTVSDGDLADYKNTEMIAIDQDALGNQATRISRAPCGSATCEVWAKPMSAGKWGVGLVNLDTASHTIATTFNYAGGGLFAVRDIWTQSDLGTMSSYSTTVAGYSTSLLVLTPNNPVVPNLPWTLTGSAAFTK